MGPDGVATWSSWLRLAIRRHDHRLHVEQFQHCHEYFGSHFHNVTYDATDLASNLDDHTDSFARSIENHADYFARTARYVDHHSRCVDWQAHHPAHGATGRVDHCADDIASNRCCRCTGVDD